MPAYNGSATDFVNFTRGSLATVTDSDGKIKWAPHNLLTNSESFDAAAWTKNGGATIDANSVAAPNGATTADRLKEATATSTFVVIQNLTAAGNTITFSVFAKTAQRSAIYLRLYNNTNVWEVAVFDLNAGTNPQNASGSATTFTNRTQAITPIGDGWNLCSITATFPSTAACCVHISNVSSGITFDASGDYAYAGNSANGVYLWGASAYRSDLAMQSNGSAYPTYNPTTPKNLLGSTEDFTSGSGWQPNAVSVTKNATIAPNGTQIANKIVETSANSQHYITVSLTLSGIYTFSVYAKAAERTHINLWFNSFGSGAAYFNLTNGTYTLNAGNYVVAADMISIGGGWYRCSIKSATFPSAQYFPVIGIGDTQTYVGDTTKGVYVWGAQLSDSASLDPYVANHFAAPTSAAYYGPRLDYDPVTRACKGLLVEQARTNLVLNSAAFDNATWFTGGATISPNVAVVTAVAPDGTNTADKLVEDNSTGVHRTLPNIAIVVVSGSPYTYSVYAKAVERTKFGLFDNDLRGGIFDLSAGTVTSSGVVITAFPPIYVGNGWYRCAFTANAATVNGRISVYLADGTGATSYTGVTGNGVLIWGAQVEAGAFATSYIPTRASTVDRNADVASVSAHAFPYNGAEGTLLAYADWTNAAVATLIYQRIALMGSPADPYARSIQRQDTSTTGVGLFYRGMSTGVDIATSGNSAKIGLAWSSTGGSGSVNGSAASSLTGTPTSSDGLPINILRIGNANDGTFFNGHIREITYLPRRVTNAELQQRTL